MRSGHQDVRDLPVYLMGEAAAYLQVPLSTVRAWSLGQGYDEGKRFDPLLSIAERSPPTLSFWNLVELYVLSSMRRQHTVPMQKIRRALEYVKREFHVPRPLIAEVFLTDGRQLFVERSAELINVTDPDQLYLWKEWMSKSLARIKPDPGGLAARLFPWRKNPNEPLSVEFNPRRAFGRPVLIGTGIPTAALAERFRAGDSVDHLAADYGLTREMVEQAIRWEHRGSAA